MTVVSRSVGTVAKLSVRDARSPLRPSAAIAETVPRIGPHTANIGALSTGGLSLQAIALTQGDVITSITFVSATTAASSATNQLFGLFDDESGTNTGSARALLRSTSNDTTTAWGANTAKTLNLTSTYTIPKTGVYYLGIMVTATTVPTLAGVTAASNSVILNLSPKIVGTSSSGLTTALPNPAAAITATTSAIYAYVS